LDLDYLEVHGPFVEDARRVFPTMPMLLHNALYQWSLTHPDGLQHKNCADLTLQRLVLSRSPWYSLHLGFSSAEVDFVDTSMVALSPALPAEVILERACNGLNALHRQLGAVPLLVENLDYNPTGAYETICHPAFISQVLQQTGVDLLLDVAHACISAAALGMIPQDYFEQLPLERVRQVHVNRALWNGERWWDAHEAMQDEDETLLKWVLNRCKPWSVTLEYNRDEALILKQITRLRVILSQF
jgi:uncharacterized protein (UPF0276 family)